MQTFWMFAVGFINSGPIFKRQMHIQKLSFKIKYWNRVCMPDCCWLLHSAQKQMVSRLKSPIAILASPNMKWHKETIVDFIEQSKHESQVCLNRFRMRIPTFAMFVFLNNIWIRKSIKKKLITNKWARLYGNYRIGTLFCKKKEINNKNVPLDLQSSMKNRTR